TKRKEIECTLAFHHEEYYGLIGEENGEGEEYNRAGELQRIAVRNNGRVVGGIDIRYGYAAEDDSDDEEEVVEYAS
ncbi:hypothetical protein H0H87_012872, partial [Tephrocybe sp. NHM501043]